MKVALVSLDQVWRDKLANQIQCRSVVEEIKAASSDIDLIVFPELTLTGFCVDDSALAEGDGEQSDTVRFFSELSQHYQCHIMFGQLARLSSGQVVNRQNITDQSGQLISTYDKVHTFSYAGETNYIAQGEQPCVSMIDGIPVGGSICYDLRFAELFHHYRERAAMVINTANWPSTRTAQWLCLLQARAIENQYFVVGVNRVGTDGKGLDYDRSSVIFNPLGERLDPLQQGVLWDLYSINLEDVMAIRTQFPFVKDRRNSLYAQWSKHKNSQ
ncbi:carbon-nitrogen family hydrolase [Vibrio parahaemolyticus]|uniref:carbon-nitrogen family hydrolase n=1 Tax=Vibrio parahaemolyticus TaxID=670 RepID=UPI00111FDD5C|nr:carbon-nitrogen family hydrolase [Vibrio parahaemolyticus]TOI33706.1 amidohydrolase [Vibrio parahaemolyticus]